MLRRTRLIWPAGRRLSIWPFILNSAAAIEFTEWVQIGIDVCISHCKYQVKPHSSLWFSAACSACAASIAHRNNFHFYQQNKSSACKVKFRQASNHCKRVFEANKLSLLFNGPGMLSSAPDKAKFFAENFSKNSNLDDSGISLSAFPSRTNLKLHNISTPKVVKSS